MARISFYGAAGEVTGSNFLVETDKHQYLVDCGLHQGMGSYEANQKPLPYPADKIDAVIVTHAHLDHVGRIPILVKNGFHGPIYATAATVELAHLVLKDAFHVMTMRDKGRSEKKEPLYSEVDLRRALSLFKAVPYHKPNPLLDGDTFTMVDAGHILGSASLTVQVEGKEIVFSGDLGHWPNVLLPHLEAPREADVIVMEATYGGEEHPESPNIVNDRLDIVRKCLEWTVQNRGVLLIPAFSLERTEEVLYLMDHLFKTKQLPRIPIFLDSPLAIETLEVFERHHELYQAEVRNEMKTDDVFDFKGLVLTPAVEDSKDINELPPPKVIIAGSGMMEGGRIMHHLAHYLPYRNTLIMVIGFQAQGTLGQKIVSGDSTVNIHGQVVKVEAKVEVVDLFSGHADNSDLLEWVKSIKLKDPNNSRIIVVHSEKDRAAKFAEELTQQLPGIKNEVASEGESVEI
jgi:metallo-beta-lactamase family protein